MIVNTIRKSNEDNLIAGTITMYRDNENKLKKDMQSFCGFGFHPNSTKTIENIAESNHFDWTWDKQHEEKVRAKNESVATDRIEMLSHLFECCYDLLLSCKDNASNSPGFEKVTGQHGPKKTDNQIFSFLLRFFDASIALKTFIH